MVDTQKIKTEVKGLCDDAQLWYYKYKNSNNIATAKIEFKEEMKKKYEYLYTNSSTLFERCILGELNIQQLNYILSMIEKVNSGADYKTTSTEVGQHMVDIYVKPLLENNANANANAK
jgi:hypothetical protein